MEKFIYDMHTHIFPQKIAEKAVSSIGGFYGIPMVKKGFSEDLIDSGSGIGVEKYLVCSTATTPLQVTAINSFVAAETSKHPEFIGFGTMHPGFEGISDEVERIISLGLSGIKLHPDFQKFAIDDKEAYPIYEAAEGRLPILFHTGDKRYSYSNPERVLKILKDFPKLICICAHLGGYSEWDAVTALKGYLGNPNIYFDTSSSIRFLDPKTSVDIIRAHGVEHVFWGTDYPMQDHESELADFMKLELDDRERQMIFRENAKKLIDDTNLGLRGSESEGNANDV